MQESWRAARFLFSCKRRSGDIGAWTALSASLFVLNDTNLATRWKVADQFRKREQATLTRPPGTLSHPMGEGLGADDDPARTSTVERVPDPDSLNLDAIWDSEWRGNLLRAALDRVKRRVNPAHYEM